MTPILGPLSPAAFLRDHWQKRPLLVRQAFPDFRGIVDRDRFLALATRADATSRLVIEHPRARSSRGRWERHDGPFGALETGMLPPSHWTLLVNAVESLLPGGWEILRAFSFIPAARIDDLMVSYAADGGSVGPHDDLYDVFLLQGPGRRRWQVSRQRDRAVDPDAAIKVLRSFVPDDEWLLEPGDMLYLPPGVAHFGVAEGPCFTYSIGFLAPSHAELIGSFLEYLGAARAQRTDPAGRYADPDLRPPRQPQALGDDMVAAVAAVVGGGVVRWAEADVADFLGRLLTRPKPRARFTPPRTSLSKKSFARRLSHRRRGGKLALALPCRGLVRGGLFFLNGEAHAPGRAAVDLLTRLAAERSLALPLTAVDDRTLALLHRWYAAGYVTFAPNGAQVARPARASPARGG
jgi:50S ribosomal protein L16 3-hydroxylase